MAERLPVVIDRLSTVALAVRYSVAGAAVAVWLTADILAGLVLADRNTTR